MKTAAIAAIALVLLAGAQATTYTSGGSCKAKATAGIWKAAQNASDYAIARAVVKGCSAYDVDKMVRDIYKECNIMAYAIVNVTASAVASCETYGEYSYGCAAAIGHADGYINAFIALVSKAVAKAKNLCPACDPTWAKAASFNIAKLVVELTTKASVTAKAAVCVGPNQTAYAKAYKKCTAQVWAHGFTYALAKAMIKGKCTKTKAIAYTKVNNTIVTDPYCYCNGWKTDSSNSWTYTPVDADFGLNKIKYYLPQTYAAYKQECEAYDAQIV